MVRTERVWKTSGGPHTRTTQMNWLSAEQICAEFPAISEEYSVKEIPYVVSFALFAAATRSLS